MSDVRALLKAKRQEARVAHPLAVYTTSGVLRCTACGTTVKQASAWDGHLGSKAHRVNVIKMKEEQKQKEEEQLGTPKRKASDVDEDDEMGGEEVAKKRRIEAEVPAQPASGFPTNFFSDPSRAPADFGDESDEEPEQAAPPPVVSNNPIDLEWEQFQQTMLGGAPAPEAQRRHAYDRATVAVEAELNDTMEGLPSQLEAVDVGAPEPLNDDQLRKLKEMEEKELIMDRLFEEERAQEEADAKVTILKIRLDALKKKRKAAKQAKATTAV